jgi:hypothetical protein
MHTPTILDVIQAVTDVAPSHPQVAVWWYGRPELAGAPPVLLVLEAQHGARPDTERIGLELAERLGPAAVAIRIHQGAGEGRRLHRLLTTGRGPAPFEHAKGR